MENIWKDEWKVSKCLVYYKYDMYGVRAVNPQSNGLGKWILSTPYGTDVFIFPGGCMMVSLNLGFLLPDGYVGLVTHRAELFIESGIRCDNFITHGGDHNIHVMVRNHGKEMFRLGGQVVIANLVLLKINFEYISCAEEVNYECFKVNC